MTSITTEDGKIVLRDGKVGTEQACCCASDSSCCECQELLQMEGSEEEFDAESEAWDRIYEIDAAQRDSDDDWFSRGFTCGGGTNHTITFNEDTQKWIVRSFAKYMLCCGSIEGTECVQSDVWENTNCWSVNELGLPATETTCSGTWDGAPSCRRFRPGVSCDELCDNPLP